MTALTTQQIVAALCDQVYPEQEQIPFAFALWADNGDLAAMTTDIGGLRTAFDTNGDGMLNASDQRCSEFRVWVDADQGGVSDAGELKTLGEANIVAIGLDTTGDNAAQFAAGSAVTGITWFEMVDGTRRLVGDSVFAVRPAHEETIATEPEITAEQLVATLDLSEELGDLDVDGDDLTLLNAAPPVGNVEQLIAAMATFESTDAGRIGSSWRRRSRHASQIFLSLPRRLWRPSWRTQTATIEWPRPCCRGRPDLRHTRAEVRLGRATP